MPTQCAGHCCPAGSGRAGRCARAGPPCRPPPPGSARTRVPHQDRGDKPPLNLKPFTFAALVLTWLKSSLLSVHWFFCAHCVPGPVHLEGSSLLPGLPNPRAPVAFPSSCLNLELTRKAFYAERIECLVFCFLVRYSGPTWHLSRTMFPLSRDPIPSVTLLLPNLHTTIFALRTPVHLPAVRRSVRALTLRRRRLAPPKRLGLDQTVTRCLHG